MGHKAGRDFFDRKREWSERKDRVLTQYLTEYVPTIAHALRRDVLVVDGFAGPGMFRDGKQGSPVIIQSLLREARLPDGVQATALLIERDLELFDELQRRMVGIGCTAVRRGAFLEHIPEIERLSAGKSVFLYLDPYTVEGLEWAALDRIFRGLEAGRSVEVLLNFNVDSFCRRGLGALALGLEAPPADPEDPDAAEGEPEAGALERLDGIVGGDWWRAVLSAPGTYPERVRAVVDGVCKRLRARFARVCVHEIAAELSSKVPKYVLVFGTRSDEALLLMNDAMVSSRAMFEAATRPEEGTFWELRTEAVVPDAARLTELLLEVAAKASICSAIGTAMCSWAVVRTPA